MTLDDYMRAMWRVHGKPGGTRRRATSIGHTRDADAEARLAEVSGDRAFARDFFARYIEGHEVADYAKLLARAGLVLRRRNPGRAWWGDIAPRRSERPWCASGAVPSWARLFTPPVWTLTIRLPQLDGRRIVSPQDVGPALERHRPGDTVAVAFVDRAGVARTARVTLGEDPHLELVPIESAGGVADPRSETFPRKLVELMAVPWLRVLNAVLGINEIARVVTGRLCGSPPPIPSQLTVGQTAEARSRRGSPASWSPR